MKLESKHLAPYLPYALKGRVDKESYLQTERERIGELKTIDLADHQYQLAVYNDLGYFLCWIDEFKPILRPLSDLTKEIEHNGKKFVPFIELAKIEAGEHNSETSTYIEGEGLFLYVEYLPSWFGLYFNKKTKMFSRWDDGEGVSSCNNYLRDKLIEWHFDIFGLIDEGLAVDINALTVLKKK